ncbi:hypothetical protein C5Y96_08060 [Blastopirellula marina]|uniref:Uncharacterized protein n=1 Tax=Blastopirellula marina TaxID=124 RepID=A0A2S8FY70_9BACT|nr:MULTISPECIES: hypothetical protein [Pirellulaceae]PQO37103.1 hypothetical protein C5Y96_08060 [Blastopirellula marina]RCS53818.1 hypothetical protein DTL36_08070 [Bremerella cremea]
MKWTKWQWVALIWIVSVFAGVLILLLLGPWIMDDFWFVLVGPFVVASLLGIWLTAGMGPVWLRLLGMLVGQSLLVALMGMGSGESAVGFTPGLAATTALTALAMLGLGCAGSILPIHSTWSVRIALWEIVVSIGLIGVTFAVIRLVSEIYTWEWTQWASQAGAHFLVFSLYTGGLMTLTLLPLLVRGKGPQVFSAIMLLLAVVLIPPIEATTFDLLRLSGGDIELFYAAHIGQTVMALAIMIPLVAAFPGVLVRQTPPAVKPVEQTAQKRIPSETEEDFAEMQ